MPRAPLPFADGFYVSQSPQLVDKRVVNAFPVIPRSQALSDKALLQAAGIQAFADVGSGTSRGVLVFSDDVAYRVVGNSLISTNQAGAITNHGTITGTSDVSMASNGINIAIQDPRGDSYFFTPTTNLLELNDDVVFLSFGQAETVAFKDGFYSYNTPEIIFSGSVKTTNDGKDFNALDFADAEINPDVIVKLHNNHNQLHVMGSEITEVFQTVAGATGFPYARINGATIQKGCAAPNSVVDFDNTFVFVGGGKNEKPSIWRAIGSSVTKISNASIDQLLQKSSQEELLATRAFTYAHNGHFFVAFTISNQTFVYDSTTSNLSGKPEWHERQTGITDGDGFQKWRAVHGVKSFGEHQVADDRSGRIGILDFDTLTEYGNKIERFFTTQPFILDAENTFSHEIELVMQVGVGDATTPDPQIRMDYSDNLGRTFNNEITKSMGKKGKYKTRVRWTRLGMFPVARMLRFKMTDPVPYNVYALFANAEVTSSG